MPSENFYPFTSHTVLTYDGFTACCSNKSQDLRPTSANRTGTVGPGDGSFDYWQTYQTWGYQEVKLDWPDGPIGTITQASCSVKAVHRHTNAGNTARNCYFTKTPYLAGGNFNGIQDSNTSWVTFGPTTFTDAMNPGGIPWTAAHVTKGDSNVRHGMVAAYPDVNAAARADFDAFYGTILYSPPPGAFTFMLQLTGAALPFLGSMVDFQHFRKYLDWREVFHPRQTKWQTGEDLEAWLDVKSYRFPVQFDMGV